MTELRYPRLSRESGRAADVTLPRTGWTRRTRGGSAPAGALPEHQDPGEQIAHVTHALLSARSGRSVSGVIPSRREGAILPQPGTVGGSWMVACERRGGRDSERTAACPGEGAPDPHCDDDSRVPQRDPTDSGSAERADSPVHTPADDGDGHGEHERDQREHEVHRDECCGAVVAREVHQPVDPDEGGPPGCHEEQPTQQPLTTRRYGR